MPHSTWPLPLSLSHWPLAPDHRYESTRVSAQLPVSSGGRLAARFQNSAIFATAFTSPIMAAPASSSFPDSSSRATAFSARPPIRFSCWAWPAGFRGNGISAATEDGEERGFGRLHVARVLRVRGGPRRRNRVSLARVNELLSPPPPPNPCQLKRGKAEDAWSERAARVSSPRVWHRIPGPVKWSLHVQWQPPFGCHKRDPFWTQPLLCCVHIISFYPE